MTTFREVTEAWIASREHCAGSLGRIQFWVDQFGPIPITDVSEDDVDRAVEATCGPRETQAWQKRPTSRPRRGTAGGQHHQSFHLDAGRHL